MRIVLISDSHGNKLGINQLFEKIQFDYLFFMGDGLEDLDTYVNLENVYAVSGNCDFFSSCPNEIIFELENKRFFITHGNNYGVKYSLNSLISKGVEEKADFVIYGHAHNKKAEIINDIYFINPGSFQKSFFNNATGLILNIYKNEVNIENLNI